MSTCIAATEHAMMDDRGRSLGRGADGQQDTNSHETKPKTKMPPTGLMHLKTRAENRAQTDTIQVWTIELPAKAANNALNFLKENIEEQDAIDLQHLRRFAKARFLPAHLVPERSQSRSPSANAHEEPRPSSSQSRSRSSRRRRNSLPATLHMLICPTRFIEETPLKKLLGEVSPFWEGIFPLQLRQVEVPLLAPTSPEQAEEWSQKYWPTMYRKTNPFGPHPSLINKAEEEIRSDDNVRRSMGLAKRVAAEAREHTCTGEEIGCVILERPPNKPAEIIAVASDARYSSPQGADYVHSNVMAHAVLRAIGMVARKRVRAAAKKPEQLDDDMAALDLNRPSKPQPENAPKSMDASLLDYPLTALETNAFEQDNIIPNGYLCVDLEIYITHEPCMMCSMAILHSRFARCVFGQRMPLTGAMTADDGLGYGLFWRPELNWKMLCWELREDEDEAQAMQCSLDSEMAV